MGQRNINQLPLTRPKLGTWPATQACALTGNRTGNTSVHRLGLNSLSHTSQGSHQLLFLNSSFNQLLKKKINTRFNFTTQQRTLPFNWNVSKGSLGILYLIPKAICLVWHTFFRKEIKMKEREREREREREKRKKKKESLIEICCIFFLKVSKLPF